MVKLAVAEINFCFILINGMGHLLFSSFSILKSWVRMHKRVRPGLKLVLD